MTQKQRQEYQKLQVYLWALGQENWPLEGINKQDVLAQVIKAAQYPEINLDPTAEQFLPTFNRKIFELLSVPGDLPVSNIPPLEILKTDVESEIQKREEKSLKLVFPTLDQQIKNLYKNLKEKVSEELVKTDPALAQNPLLKEAISGKVATELISQTPQVVQKQSFNKEESEKIIENIKPIASEEFKKAGLDETKIINDKDFSRRLSDTTFESSQSISITPRHAVDIEKVIAIEKPAEPIKEIPPLPKEILDEIKKSQEPTVLPNAYILMHPKATSAALTRLTAAPEANLIKFAIENVPLEWQQDKNWAIVKEIVTKGVFAEDLQATVKWLKNKGLENHPLTKRLEDKIYAFQNVQKDPGTGKDLPWVNRLKRYSYLDQLLGRKRIADPNLGSLPKLANETLWSKENSWGGTLHRGLNRFRFIPNTSQRLARFMTGGKYESFGGFVRKNIYQRALIGLGKTTAGRAFKGFWVKFATGTAGRLGLGAATGGWSLLISALPMLKRMAKKALAFVGGLLIMAAHYGAAALFGTVAGSLGGLVGGAWLGFKLGASLGAFGGPLGAAIGAIVGVVVGAVVGFFAGVGIQMGIDKVSSFFSNTSIPEKVASGTSKFVAGGHGAGTAVFTTIGATAVGTLITLQITSSAFVIPESEEFAGSPYIELSKTGEFVGNIETGEGIITYEVSLGAKDESLIEVSIIDEVSTRCANKNDPDISKTSINSPPQIIPPGKSWNFNYQVSTSGTFKDCLVVNTISVSAKTENQPEETQEKTITHVVRIGNPPDDCPWGWPTTGIISSIPGEDRGDHIHQGIDIYNNPGTPIYGTHNGAFNSGYNKTKGNYVEIVGLCRETKEEEGKVFSTGYYHLKKIIEPEKNQDGTINYCNQIGEMGNTGYVFSTSGGDGTHLHYQINVLDQNSWWKNGKYLPDVAIRGLGVKHSCEVKN